MKKRIIRRVVMMGAMLNSRGMGALISSSALIYCARIGLYIISITIAYS